MSSPKPPAEQPSASPQKTAKEIEDSIMMPPPPPPAPKVILDPEMNALLEALKNAAAQAGLALKFYNTTLQHGVKHVQPPQSVTAALGREIERYDQICDCMEAHVLRSLAVLQRDLKKEEKRIEDEQKALKAKQDEEGKAAGTPPPQDTSDAQALKADATLPSLPNSSPVSSHSGRRPSAISISSLHRPSLPGKLDLSSATFRLSANEDDAIFQSGLASPVTLAPKSARPLGPNELPPDFMSAFGGTSSDQGGRPPDIDLTLAPVMQASTQSAMDLTLGDSSDKPIELDLDMDMTELFGEEPDSAGTAQDAIPNTDGLFSQGEGPQDAAAFLTESQNTLLSALAAAGHSGASQSAKEDMPSPGTLLRSFPSPANPETENNENNEEFNFDNLSLSLGSEFFANNGQPSADMNFDFSTMGNTVDENVKKADAA
ncbi:hypothetical protein CC1G_03742 [Coprinopsis cinerea okayama7|uniref:Uncharacterized protein n=1 Tax=Coprinopsis cinerea (strain Okayama-7 / 130 / ATCC MYA-4618 / FGSC 9003) TaxID=240176 RepID=A8N275_COPC7|nr:hypothetical protein CC1G_03742 [Coprinopsis cinerea okayama7\|eukprot:XP_001828948.1 hypothetical protein CC1G_03742 [Coprinopsis cinerea okayama7\